jgi:broad specificity phosphatase PhoE
VEVRGHPALVSMQKPMLENRGLVRRMRIVARGFRAGCALAAATLASIQPTSAQVSVPELVQQLRAGGCVLVMRHAESPFAVPSAGEAEPDNPRHERQLDEAGKVSAQALGVALRKLRIPIGTIYSSPTFRARETVRLAGLGSPVTVPELAEGARGMSGKAEQARMTWLKRAVRGPPATATNILIVTHTPNIVGAFGDDATGIAAGEMLVFRPGEGSAALLGRIRIEEWPSLAR